MTTDTVELILEPTTNWPLFRDNNIDGEVLQVVAKSRDCRPWGDDEWVSRLEVALSTFCKDERHCVVYTETPPMKPLNRLHRLRIERAGAWGSLQDAGVEIPDASSVSVQWGTDDEPAHFGCAVLPGAGALLRAVRLESVVGTISHATEGAPELSNLAPRAGDRHRSARDLVGDIARERTEHGDIVVYTFGAFDDREYGFVFYGLSTEIALLKAALSDFDADS